jgi:hypothetical protein
LHIARGQRAVRASDVLGPVWYVRLPQILLFPHSLQTGSKPALNSYCTIKLEGTTQRFKTPSRAGDNPVWNAALTFVYSESDYESGETEETSSLGEKEDEKPIAVATAGIQNEVRVKEEQQQRGQDEIISTITTAERTTVERIQYQEGEATMASLNTTTITETAQQQSQEGDAASSEITTKVENIQQKRRHAILEVKVTRALGSVFFNDAVIGTASLSLTDLALDTTHNLWLDLYHSSSRCSSGRVCLLLYKSHTSDRGLLSYLGVPLRSIPLRIEVGDIILINNSELIRSPIKIATSSEVSSI